MRSVSRRIISYAMAFGATAALVACGSGGNSAGGGGGATLNVVAFQPFSGPLAQAGPALSTGCYAAVKVINAAGGVLHDKLACLAVDSKGDAADAVPIATKVVASTANLIGLVGPSAAELPAVEPIFAAAHIPMDTQSGDPSIDKNTNPYLFRIVPSDSYSGVSLAYWGYTHGYTHGAAVFTNNSGSSTNVPGLVAGYKALGGQLAANITLDVGQTSYLTEIQKLLSTKPDAIFCDLDPQTAATFFSQLRELDPHPPQIISDNAGLVNDWRTAVQKVLGTQGYSQVVAIGPVTPSEGAAYNQFKNAALALGNLVSDPAQWFSQPYTQQAYDMTILYGLAIASAKSTSPANFLPYITKLTHPAPGAVMVSTFAEGVAELNAGKRIYYVGAYGPIDFNRYQNSSGIYAAFRAATATVPLVQIDTLPPGPLQDLLVKAGV